MHSTVATHQVIAYFASVLEQVAHGGRLVGVAMRMTALILAASFFAVEALLSPKINS